MFEKIIETVREKMPLVHNITNYVTVNDCANVLLACGGSPIMADAVEEVEEITSICNALNLNIGTLNQSTISAMFLAGRKANELERVVVLDPVGAGASTLRTTTAKNLVKEIKFDVIKGNASEIKTIFHGVGNTKGVDADATDSVNSENLSTYAALAMELSETTGAIIIITGAIDIVANEQNAYAIYNGHKTMSKVSGTGCMMSAMLGAYLAANPDRKLEAATAAVAVMGIAGERAVATAIEADAGSGSLRTFIIDEIYKMTDETLMEAARVEEILVSGKPKSLKEKYIASAMKLYAVTDRAWLKEKETLYEQVEKALKGGATFIQLREKELDEDAFIEEAKQIKKLTDRYHVPFVINDNVNVALACDADGVHVGQDDMEAGKVRELLGSDKIIGVSAHSVEEAKKAANLGADYLGVGAVFSTTTKDDAENVSFEALRAITHAVSIPVVAIGGISKDNIKTLAGTGIDGVAVVSAIFAATDIEGATKELYEEVDKMLEA